MQAIRLLNVGGPEVMTLREVPTPVPAAGQVLINIAAGGVNFIDLYVREGRYGNQPPFTPGQEAAGTVAAVGEGVTTVKTGDRVAWCSVLGTYAQFALAPADRVVPIPGGVSFEQAAAVMLQGMTAHYLAHTAYTIRPGDEILIHAGAGGVGLLLTQVAKSLGARVLVTVSSEGKGALCRDAGADEVILYTGVDFATEVQRLTAGRGLAVVYDAVGKTTFDNSLLSLKSRGTLVLYGSASGPVPPFDPERLAKKALYLTRPLLGAYTATRSELLTRAADILNAVMNGDLRVRVERTYPLAEAAQAHRDLESRKTTGKLLLVS
ncbi:MAG: Alcohol dehydrogenase zinc-binding domain protein [Gammaproteobacteria bacterium]|nr:Alcohol dehydrogenase zinc-binding domain protein [Gammaproteobacteria bacterium]